MLNIKLHNNPYCGTNIQIISKKTETIELLTQKT